MKTIEEKAKAYGAALERARDLMTNQNPPAFDKHLIEMVFPELKEPDEERIRKVLVEYFKSYKETSTVGAETFNGIPTDNIIAWLEKQGEQNTADNVEPKFKPGDTMRTWREAANGYTDGMPVVVSIDNEYYHCTNELIAIKDQDNYEFPPINMKPKSSDEVESKFHEGDYIVLDNVAFSEIWKVINIDKDGYYNIQCITNSEYDEIYRVPGFILEKDYRLWSINDSKDGDVLVASDGSIFLFAGVDDCACKYHAALTTDNCLKINKETKCGYWETSRAVYPATKEQCDLLFEKMKDANFDWDAEKKEVNKIEQKTIDIVEPKFHPGDWIVDDKTPNDVFCVIKVLEEIYKVVDTDGNDYHIPHCKADKQFHLWSRKDAKCGDVLISSLYKQPFVYNGNYTCDTLGAYFGLNHQGELLIGSSHDNNWTKLTGVKPATKEQCNILFKKLYDSDYKWDGEKKELWHKYL